MAETRGEVVDARGEAAETRKHNENFNMIKNKGPFKMWAAIRFCSVRLTLAMACFVVLCSGRSSAREYRDWQGVGKGSWRKERIVNQTLDKKTGKVIETSVTKTTKTLIAFDEKSVTVQIVSVLGLAGREFVSPPTEVTYYRHGEATDETVVVAELEPQKIKVDDKEFSCHVRQVTINGAEAKQVITSFYADPKKPFLLRRKIEAWDLDNELKYSSHQAVIGLNMPEQVLGEIKPATHSRTIHTNPKGTTTTFSIRCGNIPGQIVSNSVKETDTSDHVVRRSIMALIQYEVVIAKPTEKQTGVGNRLKRNRDQRRTARR